MRYELRAAVSGEVCDAVLGRIVFEFVAGVHTPVSEQEELVFAQLLVPQGFATRVDADTAARRSRSQRRDTDDAETEEG